MFIGNNHAMSGKDMFTTPPKRKDYFDYKEENKDSEDYEKVCS